MEDETQVTFNDRKRERREKKMERKCKNCNGTYDDHTKVQGMSPALSRGCRQYEEAHPINSAAPTASGGAQQIKEELALAVVEELVAYYRKFKKSDPWLVNEILRLRPADSRTEGAPVNLHEMNDAEAMAAALDIFEGKRPTPPSPSKSATEKVCKCGALGMNADGDCNACHLPVALSIEPKVAPTGEAEAREWLRHQEVNFLQLTQEGMVEAAFIQLLPRYASHVSTKKEAALAKELLSLTPGGSEFVNDPQRCAAFAREQLSFLGKVARERNELRVALFGAQTRIRELEAVRCPQCKHLMRFHDNVDDTHGCLQCAKDAALAAKDKEIAALKAVILGTSYENKYNDVGLLAVGQKLLDNAARIAELETALATEDLQDLAARTAPYYDNWQAAASALQRERNKVTQAKQIVERFPDACLGDAVAVAGLLARVLIAFDFPAPAPTDRALTAFPEPPESLQADVDQAKKLVNASNKGE